MALITDLWFPDGATPWEFAAADVKGSHFTPTQELIEGTYSDRIALTEINGETVCMLHRDPTDPSCPQGRRRNWPQLSPP